jgi:hypothetical protein
MKTIRNKNEDLSEMLGELKIGDQPIFDAVSNYEITRVPGGFIYKNEYAGLCFVPEVKKVEPIKNSVVKEPAIVTKDKPKKTVEK